MIRVFFFSLFFFLFSPAFAVASGAFCEALFAGHSIHDLNRVVSLVERRVVTSKRAEEILKGSKTARIVLDLSRQDKISDTDGDKIIDAFGHLDPGEPIGKPQLISASSSNSTSKRVEVFLQSHRSGISDQRLALHDIETRKVLGLIDITVIDSTMTVDLVHVSKLERRQEYSELLLREALKQNPGITSVDGWLAGTNLGILNHHLLKGSSRQEAEQEVPLYKTLKKLGFAPRIEQETSTGSYWIRSTRNFPLGRSLEWNDEVWPGDAQNIGEPRDVPGSKGIVLQEYIKEDGIRAFVLHDTKTGDAVAFRSFKVLRPNQSLLILGSVVVRSDQRRRGFSDHLYEEVLRQHPNVNLIAGEIADTNEKILLEGIRRRLSPSEAVKLTPIGKSLIKLGFGRLKVWFDDDELKYNIEARRS